MLHIQHYDSFAEPSQVAFFEHYMMLGTKGILPSTDPTNYFPTKQLLQSCKHSESANLLHSSQIATSPCLGEWKAQTAFCVSTDSCWSFDPGILTIWEGKLGDTTFTIEDLIDNFSIERIACLLNERKSQFWKTSVYNDRLISVWRGNTGWILV